jgi:hypothetical protein
MQTTSSRHMRDALQTFYRVVSEGASVWRATLAQAPAPDLLVL